MSSTIKKRDVKIEIIRILACLLVVWYHIRELPWKQNGELSETAVFFEAICTVCVVTFFLISGFFIYDRKGTIIENWIYHIKHFFKKIFLPFIIVVILCIVFHEYLISAKTFKECIDGFSVKNTIATLFDSFKSFSADPLPGTAAHLWYIYSYFNIILVYPISALILKKTKKAFSYSLLLLYTVIMILNDYKSFYGDSIYYVVFDIVHKPVYYSMCGYVLYNEVIKKIIAREKDSEKDKASIIIDKRLFFGALIIYAIGFVMLFKTQVAYYYGTNAGYVYTSWLSLYSLILSSAFVVIIYNLRIDKYLNDKIKNAIYYISGKTLGIYLIHYLLIVKLNSTGFQASFARYRINIVFYFIYFIVYSFIIILLSMAILVVIEFMKNKLLGGLYGKKKRLS